MTEGTIIGHLEKVKVSRPEFSFAFVEKEIGATRLKKITSALAKSGMEGGIYLLTPAKNILGADFTFEEIRMGRLGM